MLTIEQFAAQFGLDNVAKGIAVQLGKSSQLLNLMHVQPIKGLVHKFGREESGGGVTRRAVNQAFPATAQGVVTPASERIEIAGAHIQTDYRMVQANDQARGNEIARRTRSVGRYVDGQLLHGAGATDELQIVGLRDKIAADQTVETSTNGGGLTLPKFEAFIDLVEDQGNGRFVFAPKNAVRQLKALIIAASGGASVAEATQEVMTYEGVKIIPAGKNHAGADLLPFTETQGSSDVTASMYCIAPGSGDETGTNVLMASNSIELIEEGIRDSFYHDQLEVAFGLSIFVWKSAARLKGITAA